METQTREWLKFKLFTGMSVVGWLVSSVLITYVNTWEWRVYGASFEGITLWSLWESALDKYSILLILWASGYLAELISRPSNRPRAVFVILYSMSLTLFIHLEELADSFSVTYWSDKDLEVILLYLVVPILSTIIPQAIFWRWLSAEIPCQAR